MEIGNAQLTIHCSVGLDPSKDELKEIIRKVDTDSNETLSFPEFQDLLISKVKEADMKAIRTMFDFSLTHTKMVAQGGMCKPQETGS